MTHHLPTHFALLMLMLWIKGPKPNLAWFKNKNIDNLKCPLNKKYRIQKPFLMLEK
jgi:hypothetical protein